MLLRGKAIVGMFHAGRHNSGLGDCSRADVVFFFFSILVSYIYIWFIEFDRKEDKKKQPLAFVVLLHWCLVLGLHACSSVACDVTAVGRWA